MSRAVCVSNGNESVIGLCAHGFNQSLGNLATTRAVWISSPNMGRSFSARLGLLVRVFCEA